MGAFVVGSLASVLSASLLFRHLGLHDTGRYVLALSLVAIVAALSDLGLTSVGVRELSTRPLEEREALARDLLGLRLTLTVIGGVGVTVFALLAYSAEIAAGVALACLGLLLQVTQDNMGLSLVVGLRLGWIAALEAGRQVLTMLFVIGLVLVASGLIPFLAVPIPVGLLLVAASYVLVRGTRALSPRFSIRRWHRFTRAMVPYSLAVAASALYFRVSILLVSALSDGTQQGYFGASFRVIEVLTAVPALLVGSAFPIFAHAAHADDDRFGYAVSRVFEVALIAGVAGAVWIAVGAPLGMAIIGGSEFEGAVPVLRVQGVALAAMFVTLVWANALLSLGRFRAILVINVSLLALNAALVAAFVPIDGARGAAIATALAEIAAASIQAAAVIRKRRSMRPSLRVVPGLVLAGFLGLLPALLTGIPDFVRLLLSIAVFSAVILASGAYPRELLDLLPWRRARTGAEAAGL